MRLRRSLIVASVLALATFAAGTVASAGAAANATSDDCFAVPFPSMMTLTTQSGTVYTYNLVFSGGGWQISYGPFPARPIVASGDYTINASTGCEFRFNQTWPARNSYGIAKFTINYQTDSWRYVGTWHMHNGTVQGFRAVGNA